MDSQNIIIIYTSTSLLRYW